jgi:hypothetical protein
MQIRIRNTAPGETGLPMWLRGGGGGWEGQIARFDPTKRWEADWKMRSLWKGHIGGSDTPGGATSGFEFEYLGEF